MSYFTITVTNLHLCDNVISHNDYLGFSGFGFGVFRLDLSVCMHD